MSAAPPPPMIRLIGRCNATPRRRPAKPQLPRVATTALALLACLAGPAALVAAPPPAAELLPGFVSTRVCDGLTGATALAVLPDGRVLIAEQTGGVRVVKDDHLLEAPALTLPTDSTWERGVLGLALAPGFPNPPHVFVHWTVADPWPHFRLSRFTLTGDTLDPSSEQIVFEGENQNDLLKPSAAGHQGGGIAIGPDGCLYASIGECTMQFPSQKLDSLLGKILRLRLDGSIPEDNPFFTVAQGKFRAIWAIGLRNPWSLAFHPKNGRLFANDIGQALYEEVNEITPGANYGWPEAEGRVELPKFRDPLIDYSHSVGKSLGGGCFYQAPSGAVHAFPPGWEGRYLVMDFMAGWLAWVDESAKPTPQLKLLARNLAKPVAAAVAPDGSLLVLERNTWVKDAAFLPNQGWLTRITPGAAAEVSPLAASWPARFNSAGFEKSSTPYQSAVDPWRPGVTFERSVVLPAGAKLVATADGDDFVFPAGLMVITHAHSGGRKVQTTVVRAQPTPPHEAAVYLWQQDGKDADLVTTTSTTTIAGQTWVLPEPTNQLALPVVLPGYDCEFRPANIRPGSPLASQLTQGTHPGRLVPLDHPDATTEEKIRSFLDVNCSACHRPGGLGRGLYDARATTPLAHQQLIDGPLISGDLGIPGAKVVVPGQPDKSMLVIRLKKPPGDPMRMPPGCASPATPPVVPILESWIRQLK